MKKNKKRIFISFNDTLNKLFVIFFWDFLYLLFSQLLCNRHLLVVLWYLSEDLKKHKRVYSVWPTLDVYFFFTIVLNLYLFIILLLKKMSVILSFFIQVFLELSLWSLVIFTLRLVDVVTFVVLHPFETGFGWRGRGVCDCSVNQTSPQ